MTSKLVRNEDHKQRFTRPLEVPNQPLFVSTTHNSFNDFVRSIILLIAADDPLAKNSSVWLKDLAERPMIMLNLPRTKAYFTNIFEQLGMKPNIVHSTRSAEIARALVSGGHGYSLLNICPPDYRQDDVRYRVLPLLDKLYVPTFGIITLAGIRKPNIVQAFIGQCVDLKLNGAFDNIVVKSPNRSSTK